MRALGAIIARNRHIKPRKAPHGGYPFAREVAFHAACGADGSTVALTGYQDARPCFIGRGTLAAPEGLGSGRMRDLADEGLLYSFDPIASLRLRIELPAHGTAELRLVDGYAADETVAAAAIARHLRQPKPDPAQLAAVFERTRTLDSSLRPPGDEALPYRFSADGKELVITGTTPRPWHHVMANPLGHGAIAQDDGEIFSFAGNAQQNALTPCNLDTVPVQVPASALYVVDLATGRIDSAGYTPQRHTDARLRDRLRPRLRHLHHAARWAGARADRVRPARRAGRDPAPDHPQPDGRAEALPRRALFRDGAGRGAARHALAACRCGPIPPRKAYYFANPRNDFRQGWAFVVTTLAVEHQEHVRDRFMGGPERDFTNPYFVAHGRADDMAGDDGRRIASFAGTVEVPAHGEASVAIALGQAPDLHGAELLAERHAALAVAQHALAETRRFWASTLGDLRVETSQPAFDRLVNDWLPYQLLTARLWGRCGPSQRGGAFGFRDQLQDVLPLFATRPDLARRQILLHAGQQFLAGDVLQWWHPGRQRRHRPRRAQQRLRPASVAALPDRPLRRADRRPRHPGRARALPRGPADPQRCGGHQLRPPPVARGGVPLRTLLPGDRLHARPDRAARPAADRQRRLERRPQPVRRRRRRRERLAGLLPLRHAGPLRRPRPGARGRRQGRRLPRARRADPAAAGRHVARGPLPAPDRRQRRRHLLVRRADGLLAGAVGCGRLRARPADRGERPWPPWSATTRSCCSRPISASTRRACPARSPTIRRACARMAASTRTAPPGWSTR